MLKFSEVINNSNNKIKYIFFLNLFVIPLSSFSELISISLIFPIIVSFLDKSNEINLFGFSYLLDHFSLQGLIIVFYIFFVFRSILFFFSKYLQITLATLFTHYIQTELLEKDLRDTYVNFYNNDLSNKNRILTIDSSQIITHYVMPYLTIYSEIFLITFFIILFFIMFSFKVLIIILFYIIFSMIYLYFSGRFSENIGRSRKTYDSKKINYIKFIFENFINIKLSQNTKFFLNNFANSNFKSHFSNRNIFILKSLPRIFFELLIITSLVIIFFYSFNVNLIDTTSIAYIGTITIVIIRFLPSINSLLSSIKSLKFSKSTINEIFNREKIEETKFVSKEINLNFPLVFNDVTFGYKEKILLENINLKIKKFSKISISGETGSGKTSFVLLLLKLLKPNKGFIKDQSENIITHNQWQSKFIFCPQNPRFTDGTLLENLKIFLDYKPTKNKIIEILKLCELDMFLEKINYDLDIYMTNIENILSAGEKQRLGIARSILSSGEIIILDEPVSNVNIEIGKKIINNLFKKFENKTFLIISHNKYVLDLCNVRYIIKKKNLVRDE